MLGSSKYPLLPWMKFQFATPPPSTEELRTFIRWFGVPKNAGFRYAPPQPTFRPFTARAAEIGSFDGHRVPQIATLSNPPLLWSIRNRKRSQAVLSTISNS